MRSNWLGNLKLQKWVQRARPAAEVMVEVARVVRAAIIDRADKWATGTGGGGLNYLDDGGVVITGSTSVEASGAALHPDAVFKDLTLNTPLSMVEVQWLNDLAYQEQISVLTARLDPDPGNTAATDVDEWRAQLFRLVTAVATGSEPAEAYEIQPISSMVRVKRVGLDDSDVVFPFVVGSTPVRVGDFPADGGALGPQPRTYVLVWAVKADGSPATAWDGVALHAGCAWLGDFTQSETIGVTYTSRPVSLTPMEGSSFAVSDGGFYYGGQFTRDTTVLHLPNFSLSKQAYASQTISFEGVSNHLDLGGVPTEQVELIAEGNRFGDSSLLFEISAHGAGSYMPFSDGDIVGTNNVPNGGHDLSTLPIQQNYDVRVTLNPGATTTNSPIGRRVGAVEREATNIAGIGIIRDLSYAVDPFTCKSEISEVTVEVLRDGRIDYRDYASEVFSSNYIAEIEMRMWIGHRTAIPRSQWMFIDAFVVDDLEESGPSITVTCISKLALLKTLVPLYIGGTRSPKEYTNATLKAVYDDLLQGQIGLADHLRGPGVSNTTDLVTNTLEETDGKDELDAIALLAGGTVFCSQGRIKYAQMWETEIGGTTNPVAAFPIDEVEIVAVTPGFRYRVPEFFIPWGWSRDLNRYTGEVHAFDSDSITRLGLARIDAPKRLDDLVSKWIPGATLAGKLGTRIASQFGTGMIQVRFRTTYAQPHLEPGDLVSVQTDRFVACDPKTVLPHTRPLRGMLWLTGPVQYAAGEWGREFVVWVRSYSNVNPANITIDHTNYAFPDIVNGEVYFGNDGSVHFRGQVSDALSVRAVANNSAFQGTSTVDAQTAQATDSDGYFDYQIAAAGSYAIGATVYVSAHAYEKADGSGARSTPIWKVTRVRTEEDSIDCAPTIDNDNGHFYLYPNRSPFSGAVYYTKTTDDSDPADPKGSSEVGGPVGTLSTATEIDLGSVTVDPTTVRVKVKPVSSPSGSGTAGSIRVLRDTYSAFDVRPSVSWMRYTSTDLTKEAVRFTARDDSTTVNFGYAVLDDTAPAPTWPGGFTVTGLVSDPVVVGVEVTKPIPGAANKRIWYQAVDAAGNFAYVKPQFVTIDSNEDPTGFFTTVERMSDGLVSITPNTNDSDTGSFRFRVYKTTTDDATFFSPAFNDLASDEFKGNTFGNTPIDLTGFKLAHGERLNIAGFFFRTTSTVAATQAASMRSVLCTVVERQGLETENSIKVLQHKWIPSTDGAGRACWNLLLQLLVGPQCQSGLIRVRYTNNPSGGGHIVNDLSYNINLSAGITQQHFVRVGTAPAYPVDPITIQNYFYDETATFTALFIDVTPYNAADGIAGVGSAGVGLTSYVPADLAVTGDVGVRFKPTTAGLVQNITGDYAKSNGDVEFVQDTDGRPLLRINNKQYQGATAFTKTPGGPDGTVRNFLYSTADATAHHVAVLAGAEQTAATTFSIQGYEVLAVCKHTSGSVNLMLGHIANIYAWAAGGTVTEGRAFQASPLAKDGVMTKGIAYFATGAVIGSGSMGDYYGLWIDGVTAAAKNWGFWIDGDLESQTGGPIAFLQRTGNPTTRTNVAHIYSKDNAGTAEIYVQDEAGNVTQLSPHDDTGDWVFDSVNIKTGRHVRIRMEELVRRIVKVQQWDDLLQEAQES